MSYITHDKSKLEELLKTFTELQIDGEDMFSDYIGSLQDIVELIYITTDSCDMTEMSEIIEYQNEICFDLVFDNMMKYKIRIFKDIEYVVSVGNIGNIASGYDYKKALEVYFEYCLQSILSQGRASNENIYIMYNGEIVQEFINPFNMED